MLSRFRHRFRNWLIAWAVLRIVCAASPVAAALDASFAGLQEAGARAADAGAAVAHIHVRDPKTGKGSRDPALSPSTPPDRQPRGSASRAYPPPLPGSGAWSGGRGAARAGASPGRLSSRFR